MSITEAPATITTGTYNADPVHSSVGFDVHYMGIGLFSGSVGDINATIENGALVGAARIASIHVKDENLKGHLLSPEFFDAERFPEVSFSGTVNVTGTSVEVPGEITLKGVTQAATLRGTVTGPVTDPYGNARYGLKVSTEIDRTAFGITWNNDMPDGTKALADTVTLSADLSLVKA
jgi:polyisoprenoid-binding protein YceI